MALFKIAKGLLKNLPKNTIEGFTYFTTDTGELYIDTDSVTVTTNGQTAQDALTSRTLISGLPFIQGSGDENTPGAWFANHAGLSYRNGLAILYKTGILGSDNETAEITYTNFLGIATAKITYTELNLNALGFKKCYLDSSTRLGDFFPVGTVLLLVYDISLDNGNGGWLVVSSQNDAYTLQGHKITTTITTETLNDIPTAGAVVDYMQSTTYTGVYNANS